MKVCLFDLDIFSRRKPFPNLALMKISAYHKARGDDVFLNFPLSQPSITYASCVFTWNFKESNKLKLPVSAICGGPGTGERVWLPDEIEHIMPDYELYHADFSMGFTSRGCPRKCPWCGVPNMEGYIRDWARVKEFWNPKHEKIVLLDNNLLAAPNWKNTLIELSQLPVREIDFNQGLDIRLIDEEKISFLKNLPTKYLRFSFDDIAYERALRKGLELIKKSGIALSRVYFYVLVGFNKDVDYIERMKILKSYGVSIYPMVYKNKDGKEPEITLKLTEKIMFRGGKNNLRKFIRISRYLK